MVEATAPIGLYQEGETPGGKLQNWTTISNQLKVALMVHRQLKPDVKGNVIQTPEHV